MNSKKLSYIQFMKNKKFFTITEISKLLGISQTAVLKQIKRGQIKAIKIGRNFVILKEEVENILGKTITKEQKNIIDKGIKKVISDYKVALKLLGQEQI